MSLLVYGFNVEDERDVSYVTIVKFIHVVLTFLFKK